MNESLPPEVRAAFDAADKLAREMGTYKPPPAPPLESTPKALPPFSGDDPRCPKCGNREASTAWWHFGRIDAERVSLENPNLWPERLHRECRRCSYSWDEALASEVEPSTVGETPTVDVYGDDTSWMGPLIDQFMARALRGEELDLPDGVREIFAEEDRFGRFTFTVVRDDGSTVTQARSVMP